MHTVSKINSTTKQAKVALANLFSFTGLTSQALLIYPFSGNGINHFMRMMLGTGVTIKKINCGYCLTIYNLKLEGDKSNFKISNVWGLIIFELRLI